MTHPPPTVTNIVKHLFEQVKLRKISIASIAGLLNISRNTLYSKIRNGSFTVIEIQCIADLLGYELRVLLK